MSNQLCPYCILQKQITPMEEGTVQGVSAQLKWQPKHQKSGHLIGKLKWFWGTEASGFRCPRCRKIILDD